MTTNVLSQWSALHRKLAGVSESLHLAGGWLPPTDMVEDARGLLIRMEVAGVARHEIHAWLEGRVLIVEGLRSQPTRAGVRFRQLEIDYGPFRRVVPLPCHVDGRRATAVLEHGVLEICLPRTRRAPANKMVLLVMS